MPAKDSREQLIYILARDAALTASFYYAQDVRWGETEEEFRRLPTERLRELLEEQKLRPRGHGRPKGHRPVSNEAVLLVNCIVEMRRRNPRLSIEGACSRAAGQQFKGVSETALRKRYYDACRKLGRDPRAR